MSDAASRSGLCVCLLLSHLLHPFSSPFSPIHLSLLKLFSKSLSLGCCLLALHCRQPLQTATWTPPSPPWPCNAPRAQLISVRAAGHGQTPGPRVAKRQRDLLQGLQQALNQALTAPCILSGWCFHMWLALTKLLLEI